MCKVEYSIDVLETVRGLKELLLSLNRQWALLGSGHHCMKNSHLYPSHILKKGYENKIPRLNELVLLRTKIIN